MVIPEGKKDIKSKTRLVKALVESGSSDYIITKAKAEKLPFKNTKKEQ